jgi:hypothetical protein
MCPALHAIVRCVTACAGTADDDNAHGQANIHAMRTKLILKARAPSVRAGSRGSQHLTHELTIAMDSCSSLLSVQAWRMRHKQNTPSKITSTRHRSPRSLERTSLRRARLGLIALKQASVTCSCRRAPAGAGPRAARPGSRDVRTYANGWSPSEVIVQAVAVPWPLCIRSVLRPPIPSQCLRRQWGRPRGPGARSSRAQRAANASGAARSRVDESARHRAQLYIDGACHADPRMEVRHQLQPIQIMFRR